MAPHFTKITSTRILKALLLLLSSLTTLLPANSSPSKSPPRSVYDVLEAQGLPMGLFPKGISDFSLDPASGRFELHLMAPSPCDAKFETRVRYETNITGSIALGQISNLSGVAAEELFLWLPVKAIRVDVPSSGLIYFDVGVVFKQFSLSFFETPKDCNVLEGGEENEVVLLDRVLENHPGKLARKNLGDNLLSAVS